MKSSTQLTETQKILIHEDDVTVHFHGTPHEAVMFTGPFHSICEWRSNYGKRTAVALDLSPDPVFPVEKLFGGHQPETPYKTSIDVRLDGHTNWIDDMFRQVCRPVGHLYLYEFYHNKSLLLMSQARRSNPYEPFIEASFPQKVLILPPASSMKPSKSGVDEVMWQRMWADLVPTLVDAGFYCTGPRIEGSKVWNNRTLSTMRGHAEFPVVGLEGMIEMMLNSSIVLSCKSEFSSLSSMLHVPTLTIYPNEPNWSRYQISGRGMPSYSCPMDKVENVSADYVLQRLNQIQSNMLPVR